MFIDDILIYAKIWDEHKIHLQQILELLQKVELYVKFSKCEFWLIEVQFLRQVISKAGVKVDPIKIKVVLECETLKNSTYICSFMGLAGYASGSG